VLTFSLILYTLLYAKIHKFLVEIDRGHALGRAESPQFVLFLLFKLDSIIVLPGCMISDANVCTHQGGYIMQSPVLIETVGS